MSAEEFDHIVVGAGSAGCVIARRLVDAGRRVALVEAGGPDYNPAIHKPNRSWELWNSPEDWAYSTEPQQHSLKTSLFWPRGKVLGGSSALNGMIYIRGAKSDFDAWAYNGAPGWSYRGRPAVLQEVRGLRGRPERVPRRRRPAPGHPHQGAEPGDGRDDRGGRGDRRAAERRPERRRHPRRRPDAHDRQGRPPDVHLDRVHRAGRGQPAAHRHHQRPGQNAWSSTAPVVRQASACPALALSMHTERIRLTPSRARSSPSGRRPSCAAPVTSSSAAGVIGSAQLLLLSGIGPADDLRPLGIDVRADLAGVGANLHDHALATILYESARKIPEGKANNLEAHFFAKSDPGMTAPGPAAAHVALPDARRGLPAARVRRRLRDRGRHHPPAEPRQALAPLGGPGGAPGDRPALPGGEGRRARAARQPQAVPRGRRRQAPSPSSAPARSHRARTCARTRNSSSTACGT